MTTLPEARGRLKAAPVADCSTLAAGDVRVTNTRRPECPTSRWALLTLVAAALMVTVSGRPVVAQATRARAIESASTPSEELELARREAEEARAQLDRFLSTLGGRAASIALLDSLSTMQRAVARLEQRLTLLQERANFREVQTRLERGTAAPQGWFGVNVQTLGTSTEESVGRVLMSTNYPQVVSVEPGSPAARAGLLAGDRLISIRGTDLRGQALDLRSVLQPGTRVPVRVERDGVLREFTVAITVRPASFSPGTRLRVYAVSPDAPAATAIHSSAVSAAAAAADLAVASRPSPIGAVQTLTAIRPWSSEVIAPNPITYLFQSNPSVLAIAGAELMRITPALRQSLGVSGGVYVVSVAPQTPAEWAGLREGDVIQRADGVELDAPVDFFRVLQTQTDGLLKLELVRSGRTISTDMRW